MQCLLKRLPRRPSSFYSSLLNHRSSSSTLHSTFPSTPPKPAHKHVLSRLFSTTCTSSTSSASPSVAYIQNLSDEQLRAVTAPLLPTRVVAGPGSGKTTVLIARVAHLIAHHTVPPWQILAITFTNKAANEMRQRVLDLMGPDVAKDLTTGTFHSICHRLLRRYYSSDRFGTDSSTLGPSVKKRLKHGWSLYDQDAVMAVIVRLVKAEQPTWKSKDVREKAKLVRDAISRVKNGLSNWVNMTVQQRVERYYMSNVTGGEPLSDGEAVKANDLMYWMEEYDKAMEAANALDFDDLLGYAVDLLRRDEVLRGRLHRRWRHVLVDEFQDTNGPQYEFVKLLTKPHHNENENDTVTDTVDVCVFVVGDPDQAIYGWRGADMTNMKHAFSKDFPNNQLFYLRDNYRSTGSILTAAQAVINKHHVDNDRISLRAMKSHGTPVHVRRVHNVYEEAEAMAADIADILGGNSMSAPTRGEGRSTVRDRDIAVLFRTHAQARYIEKELVQRGIKYVLIGGVSFWRRVEVQDVMAYLRLAVTLDDDVALMRVVNVPKRGLGEASLGKLAAEAASRGLPSVCRLLFSNDQELSGVVSGGKATVAVESFRAVVLEAREAVATLPLPAALQRILDLVGYREHVRGGGCGSGKGEEEEVVVERLSRLEQLVEAAADAQKKYGDGDDSNEEEDVFDIILSPEEPSSTSDSTVYSVASETPKSKDGLYLNRARAFLDEASLHSGGSGTTSDGGGLAEEADVDGVRLMTMHAAKGLEFDIVFVPGCVEGLIPLVYRDASTSSSEADPEDLAEEARLFFVSMTRAKSELRLSHTEVNMLYGGGGGRGGMATPNKPSRYLLDILASGEGDDDKYDREGARLIATRPQTKERKWG